ncbi:MAG TPA: type II secretion system F family protein [Candidatus Saccharimonadales bacterium]|nr:type II secretion system F family protein [Candidatus Saccharimonadales bacterium]
MPQQPPAKRTDGAYKKFHISSKDREYFTSNLALLLHAGVAVGEALESLADTSHSKKLKMALGQIQSDIDEGTPLWLALERSGVVGSQTLALVQLGEQSGKLIDNLRVAAQQEEKQRIFRSKVRSALIYPSFVMGLTLVIGLGVAWFLLPKLAETFSQLRVELPLISKIFIGFGLFLKENGLWAIPAGLGALSFVMYILFAAPKTRTIGQRMLFHIPGIGKLMYEVEVARFGYLLGTLLQAGLSVMQALELLGRATNAPRYRNFYAYLRDSFENGYSFRASLSQYKKSNKLLPPAVQQMVIAGERSGALPETLVDIGKIYEQKADLSTQNLEAILEPILLVIVWLGVMGVAVAVIMPIYSLVGGLGA